MIGVDKLLNLISDRYGLVRQERFHQLLANAIHEVSSSRRSHPDKVVEIAYRDDTLLRDLAARLTVAESFFFRHPEQFNILINALNDRLRDTAGSRPVVIWSAGCSEGQEPYSIAICCAEHIKAAQKRHIEIIASDLNSTAIKRAQNGYYNAWSFRGMKQEMIDRYFTPMKSGLFRLKNDIKKMVQLNSSSLQEQLMRLGTNSVDFLFFRNVAIYLEATAQTDIYAALFETLRPDGLLFTAPSDPAPPRTFFHWIDDNTTSVFYPAIAKYSAPKNQDLIAPDRAAVNNARRRRAGCAVTQSPSAHLIYVNQGQRHLEENQTETAVNAFRHAVFLCPADPIARFWYAFSLQRHGVLHRSLGQVRQVFSALNTMSSDTLLSDGETTVGDLLNAVLQLKEKLK